MATQRIKFIDRAQIELSSGHGGAGCVSFRREARVPRGGPDGGHGGRGGHVVVSVNPQKKSLLDLRFQKKRYAENGQTGASRSCDGRSGSDLVVEIPLGTLVIDDSTDQVIFDGQIKEDKVLLKGGLGGKGNSFYKSSVHQAPEIAQKGLPGRTLNVRLELKLIADVGLIGFPNVGKSTIISTLSAARPEVANYPFTTLNPHLGVVKIDESFDFVMADIPGLVPGAHKGVGLGLDFLRHIERTKIFVHVVDIDPHNGRKAIEDYRQINEELDKYDESYGGRYGLEPLMNKPQVVVLNKCDLISEDLRESMVQFWEQKINIPVIPISAYTGYGLKTLKNKLTQKVLLKEESQ